MVKYCLISHKKKSEEKNLQSLPVGLLKKSLAFSGKEFVEVKNKECKKKMK